MGTSAKAIETLIDEALKACPSPRARLLWIEMQKVINQNRDEDRLGYLERDGQPLTLHQIADLLQKVSAAESLAGNLVQMLIEVRVKTPGGRVDEPLVQWREEEVKGRVTPRPFLFSPPQARACRERLRVAASVAKRTAERKALANASGALANAIPHKNANEMAVDPKALANALGSPDGFSLNNLSSLSPSGKERNGREPHVADVGTSRVVGTPGDDDLDSEIRQFIGGHPMLDYHLRAHAELRKTVLAAGWDQARQWIDEAIKRGKSFPCAYAAGCASKATRAHAASSASGVRRVAARPREDN